MPRCKVCKDKFEPKYFLQKTCFEPSCILEWKNKVKAKEWKAIVFTNDRELKERLRNIRVPVIYVRQKSFLAIDGMI